MHLLANLGKCRIVIRLGLKMQNEKTSASTTDIAAQKSRTLDTSIDEMLFRLMVESAPIAIVAINDSGKIVYTNEKLDELFGYDYGELIGRDLELLVPQKLRHIHRQHQSDYIQQPHVRPMGSGMDLRGVRKDGVEFPIEAGLSFVRVGGEMLVMSSVTDMTRRKHIEEILERRVEERTQEIDQRRRIADSMRDILARLNANYSLQDMLEYIVAQTGELLSAEAGAVFLLDDSKVYYNAMVSRGLSTQYLARIRIPLHGESVLHQAMAQRYPAYVSDLRNASLGNDQFAAERRTQLLANGYHALIAVPLEAGSEVYGGLMLYYRQAKEFVEDELDLAMTFGNQTALAIQSALLRTQIEKSAVTAERNRIARDLHDSVSQTLFSASMIADVLPRLWEHNRDEGVRRLNELRQLTRGALAEMRTLLLELRPATLVEVELDDLLKQLTEATTGRARIPIGLEIAGKCDLPVDVRIAFYRIAQEALNNVAKHADADQAHVQLLCQANHATLTVTDDGVGFSLAETAGNHLGIIIMRERADSIGADLKISSTKGAGATVSVMWTKKES